MGDGFILAAGVLATLLCLAFLIVTSFEFHRLTKEADKKSGKWTEYR